jgi:leucyl-tRNA synthetase
MQDRYDPKSIEPRWQKHWAERDLFHAGSRPGAPKKYVLAMLPYPSGEMHMGHARVYSITDVLARYQRKRGFDVMHPFGWDSFGLPAENAAIKEGVHPAVRTPRNIASFKQDINALGVSVDWSTEIATSDPAYYKWNQWFFIRMLERGLVYRRRAKVNFCPVDNTVLANEQVEEGRCWRCGNLVEEREIPEWAFKITAYADKLLEGLDKIDWPERVVSMQRNWIGRSDGLEIDFAVAGQKDKSFRVFTTRADTIFGATFVVAAPEHPLVMELASAAKKPELQAFAEKVFRASKDKGEGAQAAVKEGIDTGIRVKNPFTQQEIPVWVANFVVSGYGTGAVMSVPAHDERDYEFAVQYGLPIKWVIRPAGDDEKGAQQKLVERKQAFTEYGTLEGSGDFSGMPSQQARLAIAAEAQRRHIGQPAVNFHLRDWGVSRQRYWGTPIPIIYCDRCDPEHHGIPVPDDQLPVVLPDIDVREVLTGKGEPPLAKVHDWVNIECPKCGGPARREAETMDTFVDSTWYWARYVDPKNSHEPFSRAKADRWFPIDIYVGGPEHAVLHLLYFRFWTMVMHELGLCANSEPASKLVTQGIVKGRDGEKMSKSKGNVVSPREIIREFGADTARLFILFAAPAEKDMDWSDEQVQGQHRFLGRVWRLVHSSLPKIEKAGKPSGQDDLRRRTHKTILRVTQQLERLQFNTAISSLMELSNAAADWTGDSASLREALEMMAQMLAPFAPHISEELWHELGREEELSTLAWPEAEAALVQDDAYQIAVQVNGKLRGEVQVSAGAGEAEIREIAARDPKVATWLTGKTVKKVVVIPKRLVNFVVA